MEASRDANGGHWTIAEAYVREKLKEREKEEEEK